jgi:hypothetical protein
MANIAILEFDFRSFLECLGLFSSVLMVLSQILTETGNEWAITRVFGL